MYKMKDYIVKDLGTKLVGKRKQRFALIKCPICGIVEERRVRSDSSARCRLCGMKHMRKQRKCELHGDTVPTAEYHRLYRIWRGMNRRCYDPKLNGYSNWGAKGVTVCDEWYNSYIAFKTWALANGYTHQLSIDKDELCEKLNISPKVYSPSTCIWKPIRENAINNLKLTIAQAKQCAYLLEAFKTTPEDLAKLYNCDRKTILSRTRKYRTKKYVKPRTI